MFRPTPPLSDHREHLADRLLFGFHGVIRTSKAHRLERVLRTASLDADVREPIRKTSSRINVFRRFEAWRHIPSDQAEIISQRVPPEAAERELSISVREPARTRVEASPKPPESRRELVPRILSCPLLK